MQTALPEAALETLAAVFRTMPHYPLLDEPSAAALYGDYEGWALHLLTGTPPPGLVPPPTPQRQRGQAQLLFSGTSGRRAGARAAPGTRITAPWRRSELAPGIRTVV